MSTLNYNILLKDKVNVSLFSIQLLGWLFYFIGICIIQARINTTNFSLTTSGFWWHLFYSLFLGGIWSYLLLTSRLHEYRFAIVSFFVIGFIYMSDDATSMLSISRSRADDTISAGSGLSAAGSIFLSIAYMFGIAFNASILSEHLMTEQRNARIVIMNSNMTISSPQGQPMNGRSGSPDNKMNEVPIVISSNQISNQTPNEFADNRPRKASGESEKAISRVSTFTNNSNKKSYSGSRDSSPKNDNRKSQIQNKSKAESKPDSPNKANESTLSATPDAPLKAMTLFSYTANPEDPIEISFAKGEVLDIVDNRGKWWQAKRKLKDGSSVTGIVPSNYVELV